MTDSGGGPDDVGGPRDGPDDAVDEPPGSRSEDPPERPSRPPADASDRGAGLPDDGTAGDGDDPSADGPGDHNADGLDDRDDGPTPIDRPIAWFVHTDRPLAVAARDVLTSALLVLVLGLALFAVSGVWPPLVAIESGSMEPNMSQGDLVLVVEDDRYTAQLASEHDVLTREAGTQDDLTRFGAPGDVIVFQPNGEERTPIIHRAEFHVEEGDRWVERADPAYLDGAESCEAVRHCPAPHDGYVTRGDANGAYDQVRGQSTVVKPEWIEGRAVTRAPYLGCIRLALAGEGWCG